MQVSRRRLAFAALCALVVIATGWALMRTSDSATTTPGTGTCPLATLPHEVRDTVREIHSNGPFAFPHNDGVVFSNFEGRLPGQGRGYYHEYTVVTPGAHTRSTRRIITGGSPLANPPQYFYTSDHYDSFCLITDAGR
jgi:ribonuclease T1